MNKDNTAFIVSAVRTAVGKANRGLLRQVRPEEMGAVVVREAVNRVPGLTPDSIDDVLIGCAFPEGAQGLNMGRIIVRKAGLPDRVPGATINRFCSSGLQTIAMATQAIQSGFVDTVVAGGTESMSLVPMTGYYFQPDPDMAQNDIDMFISMGITAERVAQKYGISREDQDLFALHSHQKAVEALDTGRFKEEITAITVNEVTYENGALTPLKSIFTTDEGPRRDTSLESLGRLKPVFKVGGTVTAGNTSQRSDGAAALVLLSGRRLADLDIEPIARLKGFAVTGVAPDIMGIGPISAVKKVLNQTGLRLDDIGLVELNEAFASQALAVMDQLSLSPDKVNVNGGAIALGHPLGCTGAKLTTSLLYEMKRRKARYGICTMCIGGGMGAAGLFENLML